LHNVHLLCAPLFSSDVPTYLADFFHPPVKFLPWAWSVNHS
jgi:hypothetical protein